MSLLDSALGLAARGIPVFPCGPDKAPRVAGGFHSASTDEDVIRAWPWPEDAMIGACIPEGQVVIDIDPRNGGDQTMALFPALPKSRVVRTQSGGTHVYLTIPTDSGAGLRSQLGPGVDVKKPGKGYVIVPPSKGYVYVAGGQPSYIPDWLLVELATKEREQSGEASGPKFSRFEQGTAYGIATLEKQLGRLGMAEVGGRNDLLNKVAYTLAQLSAGGELDEDYARAKLVDTAQRIGLEDEEIEKTIESGWASGEQSPWQAPDRQVGAEGDAGSVPRSGLTGTRVPTATPVDESAFWVKWEEDEPDFPYYIDPILPENAYVLAYGATEASKSMSWVGVLCAASLHGVRSSVYSLENPPATDRSRIRRWQPDPANFRLTNQLLDMSDNAQLEAMVERERDWGTNAILIDTYSHAFHSYSDDGNAKAIAFAQRVRYVMQEVGCSVIVIDHTGYQGDEPRDASAKRQQVDVAVLMKKVGEWRPGNAARFTMDNKKAARFGNPFFLTGEIKDVMRGDFKALELDWIGDKPTWVERV